MQGCMWYCIGVVLHDLLACHTAAEVPVMNPVTEPLALKCSVESQHITLQTSQLSRAQACSIGTAEG